MDVQVSLFLFLLNKILLCSSNSLCRPNQPQTPATLQLHTRINIQHTPFPSAVLPSSGRINLGTMPLIYLYVFLLTVWPLEGVHSGAYAIPILLPLRPDTVLAQGLRCCSHSQLALSAPVPTSTAPTVTALSVRIRKHSNLNMSWLLDKRDYDEFSLA